VRSILDELQALFRRPVTGIQGSRRDVLLGLLGSTVRGILPTPRYDANYGYEVGRGKSSQITLPPNPRARSCGRRARDRCITVVSLSRITSYSARIS
jgi:hypothetical protein